MGGRFTAASVLLISFIAACAASRVRAGRSLSQVAGAGVTRNYYISAERITWDYVPSGINLCQGRNLTDAEAQISTHGIGPQYIKARYLAYTDDTFTKLQKRPAEEDHLALMGPIIRAEVGDKVVVHLQNKLDFTVNFEPQGLLASKDVYKVVAEPNATAVYTFGAPEQAGPTANQTANSVVWLYRSTAEDNLQAHQNAGLYGPVIVTRKGFAGKDGKPTDVDHEFVTVFFINDENASPFYDANVAKYAGKDGMGGLSQDEFTAANLKHAINGRLFCNLEGLIMKSDQKIRWHTAVLGNEVDVHNVHWHGLVSEWDGTYVDQFSLLPSVSTSSQLIIDNPGTWLLHCHVNLHFSSGMQALFTVTDNGTGQKGIEKTGVTRTYYFQAQEELWDLAPTGANQCSGAKQPFTDEQSIYLTKAANRIGPSPIKAHYVEYTDDTFTTPRVRTPAEQHLGLLGPTIRAEVGDVVHVVFRNTVRFPTSIHVHGLLYDKRSEGAPYEDGTSGKFKDDDYVLTNATYTYVYHVPERAGPGKNELSSKIWMYHSHTDEAEDTYAGLMGAVIVSKRGSSRPDGTPLDVDREFVLFFMVIDESLSTMFVANLNKYLAPAIIGKGLPEVHSSNPRMSANNSQGGDLAGDSMIPASVEDAAAGNKKLLTLLNDPDFQESNLKHSINGYMYCNLPGLEAREGQRIRIYYMALGTEVDLHTPSLATASQDWLGHTVPTMQLLPGDMETTDAQLNTPGSAILQCNVADHITAGMRALFITHSANETQLPPATQHQSRKVVPPSQMMNSSTTDKSNATLGAVPSKDKIVLSEDSVIFSAAGMPALPAYGEAGNKSAAISSTGLDAQSSAAAFSKAAAGSSMIPLLDILYKFGAAAKKAVFGDGALAPSLAKAARGANPKKPLTTAVIRTYYIQAEEREWNYSPAGMNRCNQKEFAGDELLYTNKSSATLGPLYTKANYVEYTSGTFKTESDHPSWLGLLGPFIKTQVGDTLRIVFRNNLSFSSNLVVDGGLIPADRDLALAPVSPGRTVTLEFFVPQVAGPGEGDPSTVHYLYRSNVDEVAQAYSGLLGVLLVARPGTLTPSGTIPGVDVIRPLLFEVWDESKSLFFDANIETYNPDVDQTSADFEEGNLKHSINGYLFCNMPDVTIPVGGRVRWLLTGMGTERDIHSPLFHDQVMEFDSRHVAALQLYPAVTHTADMLAATPGTFEYNCDVKDHLVGGMRAILVVTPTYGPS